MRSRKGAFIAALVILIMTCTTAFAASPDTVDHTRKGSISLTFVNKDNGQPVDGAVFMLCKVGDLKKGSSTVRFEKTAEFADFDLDSYELDAIELSEDLYQYADQKKITGEQQTTVNGNVLFENLDLGLYLVREIGNAPGFFEAAPFVICVPMTDSENSSWVYDVKAEPKVEPFADWERVSYTDITVVKKWNVVKKNEIVIYPTIKVALYCDGQVMSEVVLSEENKWTYTWKRMDKNKKWEVREVEIPAGFIATYSQSGTTFTITNTDTTPPPILGIEANQFIYVAIGLFAVLILIIAILVLLHKKKAQ